MERGRGLGAQQQGPADGHRRYVMNYCLKPQQQKKQEALPACSVPSIHFLGERAMAVAVGNYKMKKGKHPTPFFICRAWVHCFITSLVGNASLTHETRQSNRWAPPTSLPDNPLMYPCSVEPLLLPPLYPCIPHRSSAPSLFCHFDHQRIPCLIAL